MQKQQILYQGKSILNNKLITGNLFIDAATDKQYIFPSDLKYVLKCPVSSWEIVRNSYQAYIGKCDSYGKLLFKNDIVKVIVSEPKKDDETITGIIKYSNKYAAYYIETKDIALVFSGDKKHIIKSINKVIV